MAPDRGSFSSTSSNENAAEQRHDMSDGIILDDADGQVEDANSLNSRHRHSDAQRSLAEQASQGQNFTVRGVLIGLLIGIVICFSNTYFGLQTGWVSGMAMPAALIGFAYFKIVVRWINYPFTAVENVLVQTVAGAVGTMPLGCGFVGVMPALNFIITEENWPLKLNIWELMIWALGLCFFGVVIAVPLRREVIIREKLKFPSGTATALMIGVLHGKPPDKDDDNTLRRVESPIETFKRRSQDLVRSSSNIAGIPPQNAGPQQIQSPFFTVSGSFDESDRRDDWKAKIRQLMYAFIASAVYVCFANQHSHPLFALTCSDTLLLLRAIYQGHPLSWIAFGARMDLDFQCVTCLHWSRHHNGPGYNLTHASWSDSRLGVALALGKTARLGSRSG